MRILFVCNQGKHRSKTAQDLYKGSDSAGIYSEENPLTKQKILKADLIVTMEEHQRSYIAEHFPKEYLLKRIVCLEIEDVYQYNNEELKKLIYKKLERYIN